MPIVRQQPTTETNYLTLSADGGVLFDPVGDRLIKLNPVGVEMWVLLSQGKAEREAAEIVAQRYGVEGGRVLKDLRQLLERAEIMALAPGHTVVIEADPDLRSGSQPAFPWYAQDSLSARPEPSRLTVLQAFFGLLLFDVVLTVSSADSLLRLVRSSAIKPDDRNPGSAVIGEICAAVERACVWYPRRTLCLQRSAVTTCLLRRRGVGARLAIGVRPMPFLAHAWVEVEGMVVNDFPRVKSLYRSLAFY